MTHAKRTLSQILSLCFSVSPSSICSCPFRTHRAVSSAVPTTTTKPPMQQHNLKKTTAMLVQPVRSVPLSLSLRRVVTRAHIPNEISWFRLSSPTIISNISVLARGTRESFPLQQINKNNLRSEISGTPSCLGKNPISNQINFDRIVLLYFWVQHFDWHNSQNKFSKNRVLSGVQNRIKVWRFGVRTKISFFVIS